MFQTSALTVYLHLDDHWNWRWVCEDESGAIVAVSEHSYFDRSEAERGADHFRRVEVAAATVH